MKQNAKSPSASCAAAEDFDAALERLRLNDAQLGSLRLPGCFGNEGSRRLANALKVNRLLRVLEVDGAGCPRGSESSRLGQGGGEHLAAAIQTHPALVRMHINFQGLGDGGTKALAEALEWNDSVRDLALNSNKVGKAGAEALAAMLRSDKQTITSLSLSGNSDASPCGIVALARALLHNECLQHLALDYIPLSSPEVPLALGNMLKCTRTLTSLSMVDCRLDIDAIQPVVRALESCTLTRLDLSENSRLRDQGCSQIAQTLGRNTSLRDLRLNWAGVGDKGAAALGAALRSVPSFCGRQLRLRRQTHVLTGCTFRERSCAARPQAQHDLAIPLPRPQRRHGARRRRGTG